MSEDKTPLTCGMCSHISEELQNTPVCGIITLFRCNHPKGYPMYVMPSEHSEHCPLIKYGKAIVKSGDYLPSPGQRPGLSEETAFMMEALRWYAGEFCPEDIQQAIDTYLSRIWSNQQFIHYQEALRTLQNATENSTFSIIYQSILGYKDVVEQESRSFAQSMENNLIEEEK